MAYCSKCGSQLSDGAKFCPKCGNPIESTQIKKKVSKNSSNIIVHTENDTSVQDNEKDCLSTWEKIALGVAGLYAFGSLCVSIGDGMWIAIFISLCALGVICAVFMGTIEKKYAWTTAIVSFLIVGGAIGASTDEEGDRQASSESSSNQTEKKESHQVFFENGHKYSTSFRITDDFGNTTNYNYVIKLFKDGTKEISMPNKGEDWSAEANGTHSCTIEKKSGSYRDVSATWYEVHFSYYTSIGGKYPKINEVIYVDEGGNVVIPSNNKNIYEAIATKDCIYGKFKKEKLGNNVYRCKKCGKEYDPGKEAIYSEEYCYMDYPQKCKTCGKTYTVNSTSEKYKNYVCLGTCGPCYYEHRQRADFENLFN